MVRSYLEGTSKSSGGRKDRIRDLFGWLHVFLSVAKSSSYKELNHYIAFLSSQLPELNRLDQISVTESPVEPMDSLIISLVKKIIFIMYYHSK